MSARRRAAALMALNAFAATLALATSADARQLSGRVLAGSAPVADAHVKLYASGPRSVARLGAASTNRRGRFAISYRPPKRDALVYAVATGGDRPARRALRLVSVAGSARGALRRLTINEATTVAAAYALSRFLHGVELRGPWVGMRNAAATMRNLVRPASGKVSRLLATAPNGPETESLATFNTLAAIAAGCTRGTRRNCRRLFGAADPPRGPRPADTLAALHAIALNPVNHVRRIFGLRQAGPYRPRLDAAPTSWVLSIKHTAGGYDGPGRMAFDSQGNIWATNNFEPPGTDPGLGVISLDPAGHPRNGSPVTGGGIKGVWWGIAIDSRDRVWLTNFTGDDPNEFNSPDFVGGHEASLFTKNGRALSPDTGFTAGNLQAPQGIAVDQDDNVWIANHGNGTVTVYPEGDPGRAKVISGGGLYNPFTIAIDGRGNAWVDNGSLDAGVPGTLTRISAAGVASGPFEIDSMRSPQGMAIDSGGDLWVASFANSNVSWISPEGELKGQFRVPSIEGGWGVAIDGDDNVWVASFLGQKVTQLCGRKTRNCPPGTKTGEPLSPPLTGFTNGGLQHLTAVQVDQSGNVWAANNWAQISPTVGGDGLVEFIGAAAPVATPLIGLPRRPRAGRG